MPDASLTPDQLFNQLANNLGTVQLTIPLGGNPSHSVSVVVDTTAFAVTYREGQTRQLMNGVVLLCDLRLTPDFGQNKDPMAPRISDYWVAIMPWRPGGQDVLPDGPANIFPGSFIDVPAVQPWQGGPMLDTDAALLVKANPETAQAGTTFSTGGSNTFSESVGFMGDAATGSVSDSTTVSWGKSTTIPDVSITNEARSRYALWRYQFGLQGTEEMIGETPDPVAASQSDFQPEVSAFFVIPDSLQTDFARAGDGTKRPAKYLFKLYVGAQREIYPGPAYFGEGNISKGWGWNSTILEVWQTGLPKT